jgi:hypothetical protein
LDKLTHPSLSKRSCCIIPQVAKGVEMTSPQPVARCNNPVTGNGRNGPVGNDVLVEWKGGGCLARDE